MAAPSQGQPTRSCSPPRPRHRARGAAAASASRQRAKHETPADQSPQRARRSRCRRRRAPCGPSAATGTRAGTTTSADWLRANVSFLRRATTRHEAPRLQCSRAVHHPAFEHGALPYQGAEGSPLHAAAHRSPARRRFPPPLAAPAGRGTAERARADGAQQRSTVPHASGRHARAARDRHRSRSEPDAVVRVEAYVTPPADVRSERHANRSRLQSASELSLSATRGRVPVAERVGAVSVVA